MDIENGSAPLNILLADDDPDDSSFFDRALKGIPIATNLTSLKDGEQLMSYLNEHLIHLPDLLFLDLSMPKKTGFECLIEIKEHKVLQVIPVIVFTTSFGRSSDFEQNLINTLGNIGAAEYVRKPADIDQLRQIIHNALIMVIEKNSPRGEEEISATV
jgi:CheY-like chemotaxis protein